MCLGGGIAVTPEPVPVAAVATVRSGTVPCGATTRRGMASSAPMGERYRGLVLFVRSGGG
jgi:hypothetical protein